MWWKSVRNKDGLCDDDTCWEGGGVCESLGEGELWRLDAPLLLSEAVAVTAAVAAVRPPAAPVIPMAIISCWAYPASEVINWLMISWYCLGSRLMLDFAIWLKADLVTNSNPILMALTIRDHCKMWVFFTNTIMVCVSCFIGDQGPRCIAQLVSL